MARMIKVGYGSDGKAVGQTDGYMYVVDNAPSVGATIFPSVVHYKSGKIFGTTGKVLGIAPSREIPQEQKDKLAQYKTAGKLGVGTARGEGGRFIKQELASKEGGVYTLSSRAMAIRGGNILSRQQATGRELTENTYNEVKEYESTIGGKQ